MTINRMPLSRRPGYRLLVSAPGLLVITVLWMMEASAGGGGSRVNGTGFNNTAQLIPLLSRLSLDNRSRNHSSPTAPSHRQPMGPGHSQQPVPLPVHSRQRSGPRLEPQLTRPGQVPKRSQQRGQKRDKNNRSPVRTTKGSYTARATWVDRTMDLSQGKDTANSTKAPRRPGKTKRSHTSGGKWRQSTKDYLQADDWQLSSQLFSQTDQTVVATTPLTVEPTPTFLTESTGTEVSEPTPHFSNSSPLSSSEPTPVPKDVAPSCPPPVERPIVKLVERDSNGIFHLKLENSPEFLRTCQPAVYRRLAGRYRLLFTDHTGNHTEFEASQNGDVQSWRTWEGDRSSFYMELDTVAVCREPPAQHRCTGWQFAKHPGDTDYHLSKTFTPEQSPIDTAGFQNWYANSREYPNQTCADKYGKTQLEIVPNPPGWLSQCPFPAYSAPHWIHLALLKPFDGNQECFPDRFWDILPTSLKMNGQAPDLFLCTEWGVCNSENMLLAVPLTLYLNCQRLQHSGIWADGYFTVSFSRPTTRAGGEPDGANITIPIEKRPAVASVTLDPDHTRLTIDLSEKPADCLGLAVTVTPADNRTNGTVNSPEPLSTEPGQLFICLHPGGPLSLPLAELPPDQSRTVLISLVPIWELPANFSLENPEHRGIIERAEHWVTELGGALAKGNDSNAPAFAPIRACTGHCRTHLLPAALLNGGNITIGSCQLASDNPTSTVHTPNNGSGEAPEHVVPPESNGSVPTNSSSPNSRQYYPVWVATPVPIVTCLGIIGCLCCRWFVRR